jgi:diacylglycerol kinase (ATP)
LKQPCQILVNWRAGALHAKAGIEQWQQMIRDIGLDAEVVVTRSAEEMDEIIHRLVAEGAEKVAVAGGDGTVAGAVQCLAHTNTLLGIIPQGSANNFATALRLPQDLPSALRVLKEGVVRKVDLGYVCGRYFTEAAGVGLFADALALYGTGTGKSVLHGLITFMRLLLSFRAHRLRLMVDGRPHMERAILCAIANSYRMADAVPVAPGAKVTDGELDVVIIGDLKRGEFLSYYRAMRAQRHLNLPKVTSLRAREVKIEAFTPMNVHCDDQVVGTTPVTILAQPRALKVLVERL